MKPRGMMLIHNFPPGPAGGTELQAERLASRLVHLGHPMQVLTLHSVPDSPREETVRGVEIHRIAQMPYKEVYDTTGTFPYLVRRRRSYDILHAHMAYGHAVVAVIVARCFRKRCIIKIACTGEDGGDFAAFSQVEGFERALPILHQADAMIAISAEVEEELLRYHFPPGRIRRIPNGVDTAYFRRTQPFPPRSITRFVLVGRRKPQKGIATAFRAVKLLHERGLAGRFEVNLYGEDYPEYDYPQMARDLGVEQSVHFFPFEKDIRAVYHSAHSFLLPSRGEGMSNALLEALAMELPVIVTPVSGMADVVDDGNEGMFVPPDAPEALAAAMMQLMQNPDAALRLGQNGRRKVEARFSLDAIAQQYSELYQRLGHPFRRSRG